MQIKFNCLGDIINFYDGHIVANIQNVYLLWHGLCELCWLQRKVHLNGMKRMKRTLRV